MSISAGRAGLPNGTGLTWLVAKITARGARGLSCATVPGAMIINALDFIVQGKLFCTIAFPSRFQQCRYCQCSFMIMMMEAMGSEDAVWFARAVSRLFGWIYALAWSWSFYPQPILNFKRNSTIGSSVDYPTINTLGFSFYFVSTVLLFASSTIRAQYAARNPIEPEPSVRDNDVAFAAHGLVLSAITLSMYWERIWGLSQVQGQRVARSILGISAGCVVGVGCVGLIVWAKGNGDPLGWAALDIVYSMGYAKLVVTLTKYMPQIILNYRRKSTNGFAIATILCDITGGVLSVAQLVIDSSLEDDWSGFWSNPAKFWLGNISIFFDLIFIVQHYVLYRHPEGSRGESQGLLSDPPEGYSGIS